MAPIGKTCNSPSDAKMTGGHLLNYDSSLEFRAVEVRRRRKSRTPAKMSLALFGVHGLPAASSFILRTFPTGSDPFPIPVSKPLLVDPVPKRFQAYILSSAKSIFEALQIGLIIIRFILKHNTHCGAPNIPFEKRFPDFPFDHDLPFQALCSPVNPVWFHTGLGITYHCCGDCLQRSR